MIRTLIVLFFVGNLLAAEEKTQKPTEERNLSDFLLDPNRSKLERVEIIGQRAREENSIDSSYLYRRGYTNLISLQRFLEISPGVLDAPVYDGVYNLNYRGINTSPLSGALPFTMNINGHTYNNAKNAPHYVNLIPDIYLSNSTRGYDNYTRQERGGYLWADTSQVLQKQFVDVTIGSDIYENAIEQRAYMRIAGPGSDDKKFYYGVDLNFINHPGYYKNQTTELAEPEPFDKMQDFYINSYFLFKDADEGQTKLNLTYFNQNRNLVRGGLVSEDEFYSNISDAPTCDKPIDNNGKPCQVRNSSDLSPENNSKNAVIAVDGIKFLDNHDFKWNVNTYIGAINAKQDVDMLSVSTDAWGGSAMVEEDVGMGDLNFDFVLTPLDIKNDHFTFGGNVGYRRQQANDISSVLEFDGGSTGNGLNGTITYDNDYTEDVLTSSLFVDYINVSEDDLLFDIGVAGKIEYIKFNQVGNIDDPDGLLIFINNILSNLGGRTYQGGEFDANHELTTFSVLPRMLLEKTIVEKNITDKIYWEVLANSGSGGFNENLIRGNIDYAGMYLPEMVYTTNVGWKRQEGKSTIKLEGFFNYLKDIQYISAHQGFDSYYGNAASGIATGLELSTKTRVKDNLQINFGTMFTYSEYTDFTDTVYEHSECQDFEGTDLDCTKDYSGNHIVNTPAFTMNFSLAYWEPENGFFYKLENTYVSKYYFDYANTMASVEDSENGFNNLAMVFGYDAENFVFEFYGTNLLNNYYIQGSGRTNYNNVGDIMSEISGGAFGWNSYAYQTIGLPRTIGVNFTYKIDDVKRTPTE